MPSRTAVIRKWDFRSNLNYISWRECVLTMLKERRYCPFVMSIETGTVDLLPFLLQLLHVKSVNFRRSFLPRFICRGSSRKNTDSFARFREMSHVEIPSSSLKRSFPFNARLPFAFNLNSITRRLIREGRIAKLARKSLLLSIFNVTWQKVFENKKLFRKIKLF